MARSRFQRGQVFLRGKNPKWIGRYREDVRTDSGVERVQKSIVLGTIKEYPTKRLALRALEKLLGRVNDPGYRPTATQLYEQFAERWIKTVLPMHKPSSQNSEASHMQKYIIPAFGKVPMHQITSGMVQEFVAGLPGSPKTVRNIYTTFRTAWKTAIRWEMATKKFDGIQMPRLLPVERPAFSLEQMQGIVREAEEPFKTFFWLASETGMRAGELCGIRWSDIADGQLRVRQSVWRGTVGSPKSLAGTRTIKLSKQLCEHLEGRRCSDGGLLFHTSNGRPWDSRFIVRDKLRPVLEKLGISGAGLHAFRHGNATYRLQSGEDVKTLAQRLGHSDPGITLRVYAHAALHGGQQLSDQMGAEFCA